MVRRVSKNSLKLFWHKLAVIYRFSYQRRGFWLRSLICWVIGCVVLVGDEFASYDVRFQIRGSQDYTSEVILVSLKQSDLLNPNDKRYNLIRPIKEIADITDSFFWDEKMWSLMLKNLLSHEPSAIGVTLVLNDNIALHRLSNEQENTFHDPRIVWAASTYSRDRIIRPLFSNTDMANIGLIDISRDDDGVVRRWHKESDVAPHIAEQLVRKLRPNALKKVPLNPLLNYTIGPGKFIEYSYKDIVLNKIPANSLKNKIILIGAELGSGLQWQTPIGSMSRLEVIAQITDNLLKKRWIYRLHNIWYFAGLFVLMLLTVLIITSYPQTVAFVFLIWIATLLAALSAWVFDTFNFWLPAFSPFIQIFTTWIIFVGYQATKIEQKNWQLQQEQKYLLELEQLKNNFVSLFSHDLKTPIAKIQAIVDRLLTREPEDELKNDLLSMRKSSEELHRYIKSILSVLRVESRDFKIFKVTADINQVVEEALNQVEPLALEKRITIEKKFEPIFALEFDAALIKEVVINLIENAIKYSKKDSRIIIHTKETQNSVRFEVEDKGEGISPDELENVWGKFVRGKNQDLKTKGTGLGLYLVKYFIELHGGHVELISQVGHGTTVAFELPLDEEELSPPSEPLMEVI